MRFQWIFAVAGAALLSALFVQVGPAQQGAVQKDKAKQGNTAKQTGIPPGGWPLYSRDLTSDRFSPLTQINTNNVAQLTQAWTYRPPAPPPSANPGRGPGQGKGPAADGKGKGGGGRGGGGGIGAEVTQI